MNGFAKCGHVDDALYAFEHWLDDERGSDLFAYPSDFVICGISEARGGPFHVMFGRTDTSDRDPYALHVTDSDIIVGAPVHGAEFDAAGFQFSDFDAGLRDAGARLLELARRKNVPHPDLGAIGAICGGQLVLSSITADAVTHAVVGSWPSDYLGRRLEPEADYLPAPSIV